ncbi:MAG: VWA domain-containing protein [Isosphaeraceae bacterium]
MTFFANPERLILLAVVVPLLGLWSLIARSRRRRDWLALGQSGRPPSEGTLGWLLVASFLVVALAQPRWGRTREATPPSGHDIVIAVDVSRSMACEDAVPNRLGLATEVATSLVRGLAGAPGDRIGVVAFAGRAVLRCPLTQSLGAALEALRSLRPGEVQPGGTDLASALDAAAEAFDAEEHAGGRTVILFSDGEDHAGTWPQALERLRTRDPALVVHTVALGDGGNGSLVPGEPPERAPWRYEGAPVISRRVDESLRAIASSTGGAFLPIGLAPADLGALYRERIAPVVAARRAEVEAAEPAERYQIFVMAALATAMLTGRPRGSLFRAGGFLSLALLATTLGAGPPGPSTARWVEDGRAAFGTGRFAEALESFEQAVLAAPRNPVTHNDQGATLFQHGRLEEASRAYLAARTSAPLALRTKIDFALGNSALAQGNLERAIASYDDCIASKATDAVSAEVRRRAAANRAFAQERERQAAATSSPSDAPDSSRASEPKEPGPGPSRRHRAPPPPASGSGEPSAAPSPVGQGGAGGSGSQPPPPRTGSPEERLEQALEAVREARTHRLDDTPRPDSPRSGKDW